MDAEHIYLREGGGVVIRLDLPLHEAIADRFAKGHLRRVNDDGTPYVESVASPAEEPQHPARPALSALKPEWVGYAVRIGEMTPDDAEALTKADLVERFGNDS